MNKVIPLISPKIDWDTLLKTSKQAFTESISRHLDKQNQPLDYKGFLSILENLKPTDYAENHLSFTFVMILDPMSYLLFIENNTLKVHSPECRQAFRFCIVSGTLLNWKINIITNCCTVKDERLQQIFGDCFKYFDSIGLGYLWKDYKRDYDSTTQTMKLMK